MIVVIFFKIVLLLALGIITTYTDIKTGLVKNKHLCVFGILGIVINVLQITLFEEEHKFKQLALILTISSVALLLYFFHIWAAGDCKLTIIFSLLIPYSFSGILYTSIHLYADIFATGILYILLESIYCIIKENNKKSVMECIKIPILNWFTNASILLFVNIVLNVIFRDFIYKSYILLLASVITIIFLIKIKPVSNRIIPVIALILSVCINMMFKLEFLSRRTLIRYALIVTIISFKSFASQYNYQEIKTEEVTSGMILSTGTTLAFLNSRIKGLPCISREDMTSKLTENEAISVRKWGESTKGCETVVIVKKTPFAIFIFIGTIICSALEVLNQ